MVTPASLVSLWYVPEGLMLGDLTPFLGIALGFCFLLGGCFGSFANAAAMRLVRDESPILPPSRCRFCDKPLGWRENMPLFGWLFLRGRCACAKFTLPKRYVMVEWGLALLTAWLAYAVPLIIFAVFCVLNIIIVIALLTDSEAMVLHPPSLLLGTLIALAAAALIPHWPIHFANALLGMVIGGGMIFFTNALYRLTRGRNGFGAGDIWLLGMIGACYGASSAVLIFFGASFVGAATGITLILAKKGKLSSKLPFGLFLSVVFLLYPALNMLLI